MLDFCFLFGGGSPTIVPWEKKSKDDWVAASSCDGLLFLWPVPENPENRTPPVVRPIGARGKVWKFPSKCLGFSTGRGDWCW